MRILFALKEITNKLSKDNITGYAAQSCFYITLSFFPFIMLLLTLIRFLPVKYDTIISILNEISPPQLHSFLDGIVKELFEKSSLTLTSITAVATIWASGKGIMSLMQGLNSIYGIKETRNFLVQRLIATFYTLIFLIIIVFSLVVLVFGNQLLRFITIKFPNIAFITYAFMNQKYLIFPSVLMLFFLCLYIFIPNRRKTSIFNEFPGALIAAVGWFLFSYFYSLYVNNTPNFSYMYGSLTTFVFALVWLYCCMIILFFGAEINTFIHHKIISASMFKRGSKEE
ncbi:YihY/virulence factor BrkB family protein [[Clostridium] fimetarium]|uniref:Membrane protein n=1 Tax=[Clostridium] fimetarium TaxID=99656 RepID=A0A1I0N744_9FIRM|nr:YihY/virulence factor BrkB family protein [[Clostridium] fimetarium]SEV96618.1 membrane protein [[Clostridium] fimetarium]